MPATEPKVVNRATIFRAAPQHRVFVLDRGERQRRMTTAHRLRSHFRQAQMQTVFMRDPVLMMLRPSARKVAAQRLWSKADHRTASTARAERVARTECHAIPSSEVSARHSALAGAA